MLLYSPCLILIAGLPGTGKSTVARAFVQRYGGKHVNSDLLRNEMGLRGHYNPADKALVYQAMLDSTRKALSEGQMVVVDSTFIRESTRTPFEGIAQSFGIPFFWVELTAAEDSIRERLRVPRPDSEADFSVFLALRDQSEVIHAPRLELRSDEISLEDMIKHIENYITQQSL